MSETRTCVLLFPRALGPVSASSQRQAFPWACNYRRLSPDHQHSQCHVVMRLSSSSCAENPPAWTAATRTSDPIPSARAARSTRHLMQHRAATIWGPFSPRREPPTAKSEEERAPGPQCKGQGGTHMGRALLEPSSLKDPYQFYLNYPRNCLPVNIAPEEPGVSLCRRAHALGVHTLYSCLACGFLQSRILYTLILLRF